MRANRVRNKKCERRHEAREAEIESKEDRAPTVLRGSSRRFIETACARADAFDYIERFYNTVGRHATTGYLGPVEFEREVGLA